MKSHTLVGARAAHPARAMPLTRAETMARGTLRTIGATTGANTSAILRKHPALTRRFQVLQIAEPEEIPAMEMVRGLVDTLEKHHNVLILMRGGTCGGTAFTAIYSRPVRCRIRLSACWIPPPAWR